jgi:hypothetical protein
MVASTMSELRRALSEMNEGVRALLGPERGVPELVHELLADAPPEGRPPRSQRRPRAPRRHLSLVK